MVRSRRLIDRPAVALGALLQVMLLVGCAHPIGGSPLALARVDAAVAGATVAHRPGPVQGDAAAAAAAEVSGILADIEDFWVAQLGDAATPLKSGYTMVDTADPSADSGGTTGACSISLDGLRGNAFYCPANDSIVIDAAALVPVLRHDYGVGGLAVSLAHEYGHAIQARVGPTQQQRDSDPGRYPQILLEAQADCAAGAFVRWVVDGHSGRLRLPAGLLGSAVAPLVDFRDPTSELPTEQSAHGLSLDRLRFAMLGMRQGTTACSAMTMSGLRLTLGRAGTRTDSAPRFADLATVTTEAEHSVTRFTGTDDVGIADPADLTAAAPFGQFAQAAATVLATGRSGYPDPSGAACFTGAWAAAVFAKVPAGGLGSWPGDADEALDLIRHRPGADWDDIAGFVDGFDRGRAACH